MDTLQELYKSLVKSGWLDLTYHRSASPTLGVGGAFLVAVLSDLRP